MTSRSGMVCHTGSAQLRSFAAAYRSALGDDAVDSGETANRSPSPSFVLALVRTSAVYV